jgi:Tol biopolymer transport system component
MKTIPVVLAIAALGVVPDRASAQLMTRASLDSSGAEGNDFSEWSAISADARFVTFQSDASNLVANDLNRRTDIFVHDLATGLTIRVSVASSGGEANNDSYHPSISGDGTVVAFESYASNLVAGDVNGTIDAFVHDGATGATELMNVDSSGLPGNGASRFPAVSADGRVVAFWSDSTNLVPGDGNHQRDVFIHDRVSGATERVSVDSSGAESNGQSFAPSISADGRIVVFLSDATNLVPGDTNGATDVFVHDRTSGFTERVNVDSAGHQADDASASLAVSGDGRTVAFHSWASNLVAGDANQAPDIFVHDRQTGVTELASVDSTGAQGNSGSELPSLSDDGQIVAFDSDASNLVSSDTNGVTDAFVHDRTAGTTERVSISDLGVEGDAWSDAPQLSSDGQTVTFSSGASNLVPDDGNGRSDVFVRFPCPTSASWSNYGAGYPGTLGVPTLTSNSNPVLGSTFSIDLGDSSSLYTVALLFVGDQRADIPSTWGGHLLVQPTLTVLLGLPPSGAVVRGAIPMEPPLCGVEVDLQAIELDPGAAKGVSFTPGLELVLGR